MPGKHNIIIGGKTFAFDKSDGLVLTLYSAADKKLMTMTADLSHGVSLSQVRSDPGAAVVWHLEFVPENMNIVEKERVDGL